jgi:hypothetical protein
MNLLDNLNISTEEKLGMDRESLLAQIREPVTAAETRS